jgi:hypothetical protein
MGDVVDINEWIEAKVNKLAQRYGGCRGTNLGKELECVLKEWGNKRAKYKTHYLRTQRAQEKEKDGKEKTLLS